MPSRVIFERYLGEIHTLSRAVTEALRHLSARNYAPTTIEGYRHSFEQFMHHLVRVRGLADEIRHFTGDNVQGFAEWLTERGAKASTVHIRLTALSSLAQTMMKLKDPRGRPYLTQNPTRTFDWPTVDHAETKFLLPDELQAFLNVERCLRESIARPVYRHRAPRVRARPGQH